jgi:hypothetical protein
MVTAPAELRAARLAQRGRETAAWIEQRMRLVGARILVDIIYERTLAAPAR